MRFMPMYNGSKHRGQPIGRYSPFFIGLIITPIAAFGDGPGAATHCHYITNYQRGELLLRAVVLYVPFGSDPQALLVLR